MTKLGELDFYAAMNRTLQAVFPFVGPYQSFIPCFGTPWGFAVCGKRDDPRPDAGRRRSARRRARARDAPLLRRPRAPAHAEPPGVPSEGHRRRLRVITDPSPSSSVRDPRRRRRPAVRPGCWPPPRPAGSSSRGSVCRSRCGRAGSRSRSRRGPAPAPPRAWPGRRRGRRRAVCAAGDTAALVLGADTLVVLDGRPLGKPVSRATRAPCCAPSAGRSPRGRHRRGARRCRPRGAS